MTRRDYVMLAAVLAASLKIAVSVEEKKGVELAARGIAKELGARSKGFNSFQFLDAVKGVQPVHENLPVAT